MKKIEIMCEVSARHVHLSQKHLEELFGKDAELGVVKTLSQRTDFISDKRVDLVTEKTTLKNVAVLGPVRSNTQVEISRTDSFAIGLKNVPLRLSGDLIDTPGITLQSGDKQIKIDNGVIIARRHAHLSEEFAKEHNIADKQLIAVEIDGDRGGILNNLIARVSTKFVPAIHIDTDEANALGFSGGNVKILIENLN
ncbi:MAG: phosphate propanoyltransferase [Firmicutes bacterium]|nr:phosphate propanoyltransferase [Bacillota bacterium]